MLPLRHLSLSTKTLSTSYLKENIFQCHNFNNIVKNFLHKYQFINGFSLLPHPEKADKGGEDAILISEDNKTIGVADGVGGWAESGIDPGLYAKGLVKYVKEGIDKQLSLEVALKNAYDKITNEGLPGSTTMCLLTLEEDKIRSLNIGDSQYKIFRLEENPSNPSNPYSLIYSSPVQEFQFNFPYQIGSNGDMLEQAAHHVQEIKHKDIIMTGTDGIFDNIFDEFLTYYVNSHFSKPHVLDDGPPKVLLETTCKDLANFVSKKASIIGANPSIQTPFEVKSNFSFLGGKLDDSTVIITYVDEMV